MCKEKSFCKEDRSLHRGNPAHASGGLHGGVTVELGFKDAWELMIPRERKLQNTIPPLNFSMTACQGSWRVRSLTC